MCTISKIHSTSTTATTTFAAQHEFDRPLLIASGKRRFILVMIDYFSKWIEANSLAKITSQQLKILFRLTSFAGRGFS